MTATDSQATEGNRLTIRYGIRWDGRGRPKPTRMAALGLAAIALLLPASARAADAATQPRCSGSPAAAASPPARRTAPASTSR